MKAGIIRNFNAKRMRLGKVNLLDQYNLKATISKKIKTYFYLRTGLF